MDEDISPSSSPRVVPQQRTAGHHRRGSELIGLDPAISSSPTKGEFPLPNPPFLPTPGPGLSGQGPGRRGHAHRRSAAISSMDLSAISKVFPPKPLGGSAPSTPVDIRQQHLLNEDIAKSSSRSFSGPSSQTPPASPARRHKLTELVAQSNQGSINSVPVFHRPLSPISSEDGTSTVRGNHSVTGSTTSGSIILAVPGQSCARPKTAGAALDLAQDSRNSPLEALQLKRPLSASASIAALNTNSSEVLELPPSKRHLWDDDTASHTSGSSKTEFPSDLQHQASASVPTGSPTSAERPESKKQKKVRSWAGILTRKAKRRSSKKPPPRKAPTPPPILNHTNSEIGSLCEVNFDNDNTIVISTPTSSEVPKPAFPTTWSKDTLALETSWKPRSFYEQGREWDVLSPVIDLDAALGPFNTPEMGSDRVVNSGFSAATKRMYSGGRRGEFVGPEMRYHRRAESAPEMPPFDRSALGMARFGGTSTLANPDVFYEEEEDAFLAGNETSKPELESSSGARPSMIPEHTEIESFASGSSATVTRENSNTGDAQSAGTEVHVQVVNVVDPSNPLGISLDGGPGSATHDHATTVPDRVEREIVKASEHSNLDPSPRNSVEIVDDWVVRCGNPTSSNLSSQFIHVGNCPASSPEDVGHSQPQATSIQEMPQCNSNIPSPDPSSVSFEVPRLATASSSITDRHTLHSAYGNEPVIGCAQGSVEDVPSLTSSASTMTGNTPHFSLPFYICSSADRVGSFSAAVPRRASYSNAPKRSSLSSLSKLVGSTSGQKSKLSYEEKAPGTDTVKIKKRGHRMSRLMHFWRSKEKQSGTDK